ncbi:vitamin B12-dependent ribonucleotide reductase [Candidatus Uhrbacteria bacterium]|nr:vitamin B12-dependent ribonucleotide reductase [Candidatus Uhrbacteria bacterium]
MTYQVLLDIDRRFGAQNIPGTDDISRTVAVTLIDNNLPHVAKGILRSDSIRPSEFRFGGSGLRFRRFFVKEGSGPYDGVEWEVRDAVINDGKGRPVFEQRGVEVPKSWSQGATNIVVSKYFRGKLGDPERESSVRQMVDRVSRTISRWGGEDGYFATEDDYRTFESELTALLVSQKAAFNSPVWFNVGVQERPQCSACFINSVSDDLRSILNLAVTEGMLFKYGSGTGTNLSTLRSSRENLANSSGRSSGPVSFMKGYDAFAGVIKSGGKTRRAAKMVILNVDHPDIVDFITCKIREEAKAKALIRAGYDPSLDGEAYGSIFFQNANNSVRVTDGFMQAVADGGEWKTKAVVTGETVDSVPARDLMRHIAQATWECGDPGMQFDTAVNRWNTVPNSGRINGSNPCSEYMFLDDSSCNLASLNLMRFRREDGEFDHEAFRHAVDVMITAQEILVGRSSYPTPAIDRNSHDFRPLGLGYANLGALLMSRGLAYDSDEGRNYAAALTAMMTGYAYCQSSRIAESMGPFALYRLNEKPFLKVIGQHRDSAMSIPVQGVPDELVDQAKRSWESALELGMRFGFRNAQVSVLAPTGTIGFLMDCDTTGVEPDIALVKYKWLVGGGLMKIVNQTVPEALERLGYAEDQRKEILDYLDRNETIEGSPNLKEEHLPVFDCAFRPSNGHRSIRPMGHIRMMGAIQPFLSGAISKTVNMPNEATVEDIERTYMEAWKLGLKAVAIYRDGSKGQQVLKTSSEGKGAEDGGGAEKPAAAVETRIEYRPLRRRLPEERRSVTHKFSVAGHAGFITVGLYDDGRPGEIFLRMSKGGSVISGLMDAFAVSTSIALQYGVPLKVLVNKFAHVRFEPSGFTGNSNIRIAKSLVDYIFRWLALRFMAPEEQLACGVNLDLPTLAEKGKSDVDVSNTEVADRQQDQTESVMPETTASGPARDGRQMNITEAVSVRDGQSAGSDALTAGFDVQSDAPACDTCGALMVRNGACYKCLNCGSTSGCS